MNVFEGKVVSEGMKVGIVAARFNEFIVPVASEKTLCILNPQVGQRISRSFRLSASTLDRSNLFCISGAT